MPSCTCLYCSRILFLNEFFKNLTYVTIIMMFSLRTCIENVEALEGLKMKIWEGGAFNECLKQDSFTCIKKPNVMSRRFVIMERTSTISVKP